MLILFLKLFVSFLLQACTLFSLFASILIFFEIGRSPASSVQERFSIMNKVVQVQKNCKPSLNNETNRELYKCENFILEHDFCS